MIKKLQVPKEPMPEEYKEVNLNRPTLVKSEELSLKDFQDLDLQRLPSLRLMLKDLKKTELLDGLNSSMNHVINLERVGEKTEAMKKEIVLYVMEEIERFVLKPKAGQEKKYMAIEILRKMFYDDDVLTGVVIDGLMKNLHQVGMLRRWVLRAYRYFKKKLSTKD